MLNLVLQQVNEFFTDKPIWDRVTQMAGFVAD